MRSKRSRSASRRVSTTASGCSRKRSAIRPGGASTCAELPRRRGSVSSSVAPRRTATIASWSGTRPRAWTWTLPVATQGTPSRSASSASSRLRRRSWRQYGRCSSTLKRSRPKARSRPARHPRRRRDPPRSHRPRPPRRCPRNPRGRPGPPSAPPARTAATRGEGLATLLRPCALVGIGDQAAEIAPADRGLGEDRDVRRSPGGWRRAGALDRQLRAHDRAYTHPLQACANSIAPLTPSWSVSASAS